MADTKMVIAGDAAQLLNQYQKIIDAEKQYARSVGSTAREIAKREDAMQQGMEKNIAIIKRMNTEGTMTFSSFAKQYDIMAKAAQAWSVVSEHALQVHKDAANRVKMDAPGLGQLGQLAGGQQLQNLINEAVQLRRSGVTRNVDEAAKLVFQMESANLGTGDRQQIANLKKWQIIQDASAVTESLATLRTAMGAGETGSFQQMISKGFAAAGPTPGEFQDLMTSTAQVAPSAKLAGWGDEQLLSVMGVLTKATGAPDRAEPLATNFIKTILERPELRGRSIPEIIKDIEGANMNTAEKRAFFGGRGQGLAAYEILAGKEGSELYGKLQSDIYGATNADLGGQKVRDVSSVPQIRALVAAQEAEGRADAATSDIGVSQAMFEARIKKYDTGTILGSANKKAEEFARWLGVPADYLGQEWGDIFGGGARARQEGALTAGLPSLGGGAAAAVPSRPYQRTPLIVPQVPEEDDPRIVSLRAKEAEIELQRLNRETELRNKFGADGRVTPQEERSITRDKVMQELVTTLKGVQNELKNVEARRRVDAGRQLRGGSAPPN
jgi:hypothetical protein